MSPEESEIATLPFHDNPLSCEEVAPFSCQLCCERRTGIGYRCVDCNFSLHKDCVERSLTHPFHCSHLLKIFLPTTPDENENLHCHFCQISLPFLLARCTICNISMDLPCLGAATPRTLFQPKHHKHTLTVLSRLVTFTCNACGVEGDRNPYVCLECNLMEIGNVEFVGKRLIGSTELSNALNVLATQFIQNVQQEEKYGMG
ncbi:hypothetical protein Bca4012_066456 [Brassica carinata]